MGWEWSLLVEDFAFLWTNIILLLSAKFLATILTKIKYQNNEGQQKLQSSNTEFQIEQCKNSWKLIKYEKSTVRNFMNSEKER